MRLAPAIMLAATLAHADGKVPPPAVDPATLPVCTGFKIEIGPIDAPLIDATLVLLPEQYRGPVARALGEAGANAGQLIESIRTVPVAHREGLSFLLANMPVRDLTTLDAAFLVENVALAYEVRDETAWGQAIPRDVFLNDVLPYANLNERRDNFRADFKTRFLPIARDAGSIETAVARLNRAVFSELNVSYHASKRPKPDQSPYESTAARYASCTGLSILLTDALRSVGVPARVAGTPRWSNDSGNHTWVEIWDDGAWHHVGAAEPAPYDHAWFNGLAAQADPDDPEHRIYAASFRRTGILFPLVWDRDVDYVHAVDVTRRYRGK